MNRIECPKCHSIKLRKYGFRLLSGGVKKQQYQCKVCGKVFVPPES
jgi:transposase-like protein